MSMTNDLISRSELKEAAEQEYNETLDGIVKFGMRKVINIIDNAPTVKDQSEAITEALRELRTER